MNRFLRPFLLSMIVMSLVAPCAANAESLLNPEYQSDIAPVSMQQLKAQVDFFRQALDELGAVSPLQVAKLWAKSEETRNGVYQYSVSCGQLKDKLIKKWGKPEESFWIIGGSSPWVDKYEITKNKKINENTYEITIKYYWATSAGNPEPTYDNLLIKKYKDYWCVQEVK